MMWTVAVGKLPDVPGMSFGSPGGVTRGTVNDGVGGSVGFDNHDPGIPGRA
jgi:hypothetical protein